MLQNESIRLNVRSFSGACEVTFKLNFQGREFGASLLLEAVERY